MITSPREVYEAMRSVPEGLVTTVNELRSALAKGNGAMICRLITTGIFAWVSAHARALRMPMLLKNKQYL